MLSSRADKKNPNDRVIDIYIYISIAVLFLSMICGIDFLEK